jgi:signal transduction histidine kinase
LISLDNALKHSTGDINVSTRLRGKQIQICVQDSGEGISPEKLEHVFDRFYRGEDASAIPGFGLGLPIAKSLTERMDGTILLQSEVGKGTILEFNFPRAVP